MSDENIQYVPVEQWCGFIPQHPSHLWPEIVKGRAHGNHINMYPCPGDRAADS